MHTQESTGYIYIYIHTYIYIYILQYIIIYTSLMSWIWHCFFGSQGHRATGPRFVRVHPPSRRHDEGLHPDYQIKGETVIKGVALGEEDLATSKVKTEVGDDIVAELKKCIKIEFLLEYEFYTNFGRV